MKIVLNIDEVEQELDKWFKDWRSFPVYRRIGECHLDHVLFHHENAPARGVFSDGYRTHYFLDGEWAGCYLNTVKRR